MREIDCGAEIRRRVALVGVDEDEVEGLAARFPERRKAVERGADADLDLGVQPGARDVAPSHLCVVGVELEADQAAIVRERSRHPDRAVPAERADLEDPACFDGLREDVQELPLRGRDRDVRQLCAVLHRRFKHGIGGLEQASGVRVDGVPAVVIHGPGV